MAKSKTRTIRGDRLHIGFFGKRNVGKSSLINAVSGQQAAIVSHVPGTTTDPVYKTMELAPLGPVVLIDTAGLDDSSDTLGQLRKEKTRRILEKTDLALLVVDSTETDFSFEESLLVQFQESNLPYSIILNKTDMPMTGTAQSWLADKTYLAVSATKGKGIGELKKQITEIAPEEWEPPFVKDLLQPGDLVLLVVPIDLGAPKGRLIMPQVKALRDILDADAIPVMCKDRELPTTLEKLKAQPDLVITDSQVFPQVAADLPKDTPLTSFSILSARQKGDLAELVAGLQVVQELKPGDRVLIAESCSHHPTADDIGRIKIPRWLNQHIGGGLEIDVVPGHDFPKDLVSYKLVVHCGACTLNRKEMIGRINRVKEQGVAITNYGVLISFLKSLFPRALEPLQGQINFARQSAVSQNMPLRSRMAKLTEI